MKGIQLIAIIFLGLGFSTYAQTTDEEMVAIGQSQRKILRSNKLGTEPQIIDTAIKVPEIKYSILPKSIETSFEIKPIKPARIKVTEKLEKLYRGYAKVGVGNYTTPYAELYYNSARSRTDNWHIRGKFHGALSSMKNVGVSTFNDSELGGHYKHFFNKHTLKTRAFHERNRLKFYGFDTNNTELDSAFTSGDNIKRTFHFTQAQAQLESRFKDSTGMNHNITLNYYYLNDSKGAAEHNIQLNGVLSRYLEDRFSKELAIADIGLNVNRFAAPQYKCKYGCIDTSLASTNVLFKLVPSIQTTGRDWKVKAGLGIYTEFSSNSPRIWFFPNVEAKYSLFNNIFTPYVGAAGSVTRTSFNSLRGLNPYVQPNTELRNQHNDKIPALYGGFRGAISSTISFNLRMSTERFDDYALFVNDTTYSIANKFEVRYDKVNVFNVMGQLSYNKGEKFKIHANGNYFVYTASNELYAWHRPVYDLTLTGIYDLANKFVVKADVFLIGHRKAVAYAPGEGIVAESGVFVQTLKPFVDANLGFEYRYNKKLSAFLNVNNIAAQKYQYWNQYPVQSINILGGVTYSF